MPKSTVDEVQVLRFFEDASIEKAETVFNIIGEMLRRRPDAKTRPEEAPRPRRSRTKATAGDRPPEDRQATT